MCECIFTPIPLATAGYTQIQQNLTGSLSFSTLSVFSAFVIPLKTFTLFTLTPGVWAITYSFSAGPFVIGDNGTINSYFLVNQKIYNSASANASGVRDGSVVNINQTSIVKSNTSFSVSVNVTAIELSMVSINFASIIFLQISKDKFDNVGYGFFFSNFIPSQSIMFLFQKLASVNVRKLGNSFLLLKSGVWQIQYSLLAINQSTNTNNISVSFLVNNQVFNTLSQTIEAGINKTQWLSQTNVFTITTPTLINFMWNSTASILFSYPTICMGTSSNSR